MKLLCNIFLLPSFPFLEKWMGNMQLGSHNKKGTGTTEVMSAPSITRIQCFLSPYL